MELGINEIENTFDKKDIDADRKSSGWWFEVGEI